MDPFEEIEQWKKKIDEMDQIDLARLRRFAPVGHIVFNSNTPLPKYFEDRFKDLGGMTSAISKLIG